MRERDITALIEPILRERLSESGFKHATIAAGRDHDGDPAIFVDLFFDGSGGGPDSRTYSDTIGAVWQALLDNDDERFPYLRLHIPDVADGKAA
jgi:hypothetical protein